jgi:BlaI family transcriptional regulator, penicillinase repressor
MTETNRSDRLSRRERQILDVLYARGSSTAAEIQGALPDAPSYSAIRALLRILEEKGHLRHHEQGPRYVFSPTVPRARAKRQALKHLLRTFFEGSPEQAMAALLDVSSRNLTDQDFDRLARLVEEARQGGRK